MSALTATTITLKEARGIICQNCTGRYDNAEPGGINMSDYAAARAMGWTVWEGLTIGGREERRVFCPRCAGRTPEPETDNEPKWDARCNTCGWAASDADEYADEPFTEDDARAWRSNHECEPDVELVAPKKLARRP